jgi:hypothetical protein
MGGRASGAASTRHRMTGTAIFCFVAIVLVATLRAFGPRRARGEGRPSRRAGAGLVLGGPVQTLGLGPGRGRPARGRIVSGH